ncbi:MAG: hypothetical protein K8I29_12750 [Alphaproteobacteria bacterium]|uniref:Uncharacterized protein n=1 Tax=Candidatus Nitrobium versatile TaxID=2884831 RepID=A0A953LXK6_9BACT|nr:hypothetical protein [Candidatus Nitrobium versatile]
MKTKRWRGMPALFSALAAIVFLVSCGGGGGSSSGSVSSDTVVSGVVSKGPVSGATVNGYAIEDGAKGRQLGTATTGQDGSFSMNVGSYSGAMLLEASGGSYMDEATGQNMPMGSMLFRAAAGNVSGSSSMSLTPPTGMAVQYMNGNYSGQMMSTANQVMGSVFGVSDIIGTKPKEVQTASKAGQENETYYGLMLASLSQFASTTNSNVSSIMQDFLSAMTTNNTQMLNYYTSMMSQSFTDFTTGPRNMTGMTFSSGMMSTSGITGMMGGSGGTAGNTMGGGI